jgi:hypothetical protein
MRLPRMTTRRWWLCIVACALVCAGIRVMFWHQRWSPLRRLANAHAGGETYARGQHDHFAALLHRYERDPRTEPMTEEELENCRRAVRGWAMIADWHGQLRRKYEDAAGHPWEPIGPDPPRPWETISPDPPPQ